MRILVAIPALDLEVNDIGQALHWIAEQGHTVVCVAARDNPSKSVYGSAPRTVRGNLVILRPWRSFEFPMMLPEFAALRASSVLRNSEFDIVLCSQEFNFLWLQKYLTLISYKPPMAVLTEHAWDLATQSHLSGRGKLALRMRGVRSAAAFFRRIASSADVVITSNPTDSQHLPELREWNANTVYVPWCTDPGIRRSNARREANTGIYAGALTRNKNPDLLFEMVRDILGKSADARFIVAGVTADRAELDKRKAEFGPRFESYYSLTMRQTAEKIAGAGYALSAAEQGGWGFIGGCWALETPVVLARQNTFVQSPDTVLDASRFHAPHDAVEALLSNGALREALQAAGRTYFERYHSAEAVGTALLNAFSKAV